MKKYTKNINMRNVNGYEPGKIWTQVWCLKECQIIKLICFKNPQLVYEFFETCTFNLSLCHMIQELKNCSIQLFFFSNFFLFFLMMQSARVEGNPWVLYSEERYQKFLAFLEEVSDIRVKCVLWIK